MAINKEMDMCMNICKKNNFIWINKEILRNGTLTRLCKREVEMYRMSIAKGILHVLFILWCNIYSSYPIKIGPQYYLLAKVPSD